MMILVLFIIFFIAVLLLLTVSRYYKPSKKIQKIIWTYWDNSIPLSVVKLINEWEYLNPSWKVIILTNKNLSRFLKTNELPEKFYDGIETPQYSSDIVRIAILIKYGGVWLDASIKLLKSLDWVIHEFNNTNIDYLGYQMPSFTTNKHKPIIESWFIASKPNTKFLKEVYKEMRSAFGRREQYVNRVKKLIDLQNIPEKYKVYLCIHVCMQFVLQTTDVHMKKFKLIDAYKDAFFLHGKFNWDSKSVVNYMKTKKFFENKNDLNLVKLRNDERNLL
jgi:hypothetical protein